MSYIYKITNNLNGRSYIGQTSKDISDRYDMHKHDAASERCRHRPLYEAMNKYGSENFSLEVIEECDPDKSFEREIFWVDYFDTFRNGYNATYGGAGRTFIDYRSAYETYKKNGESVTKAAAILGIDCGHLSTIVRSLGGTTHKFDLGQLKRVDMFSGDGEYIRTFASTRDAARFLVQSQHLNEKNVGGYAAHISSACRGVRSTCQGFKWKYSDGIQE